MKDGESDRLCGAETESSVVGSDAQDPTGNKRLGWVRVEESMSGSGFREGTLH